MVSELIVVISTKFLNSNPASAEAASVLAGQTNAVLHPQVSSSSPCEHGSCTGATLRKAEAEDLHVLDSGLRVCHPRF